MRNMTERELTDIVIKRYEGTPDPRLRQITQSLIRHLHAFVRDVELTEPEWLEGMQFLTRTGQICDDRRQEMILLSDNLGISSLVNMISAHAPQGTTETTVVGPFYVPGSPLRAQGESIMLRETDEQPLIVHGQVRGERGEAIPGATIEIWQTDSNGKYDIQDAEQPRDNLRGYYVAGDDGGFVMRSIRPTSYPIPTDGPVGELLEATARSPWRPAHLHAIVRAQGYRTLTTHLFDSEDPHLDTDVVFAVKENLIRTFAANEDPAEAARFGVAAPFWELNNDFVLASAG